MLCHCGLILFLSQYVVQTPTSVIGLKYSDFLLVVFMSSDVSGRCCFFRLALAWILCN